MHGMRLSPCSVFIAEGHHEAVGSDGQLLRVLGDVVRQAELAASSHAQRRKSLLREMLGRTRVLTGSLWGGP